MGKVLAVWSHTRRSGKSIVAYMLARHMAESGNLRILVCCLNYKCSSLYRLLNVSTSAAGLEELVNCGITEEHFFSTIPKSEKLFFLGSYKMSNSYASKNITKYADLFGKLKDSFDLVLVDAASEAENVLTRLVLERADMVIQLYCQDIESIMDIKTDKEILLSTYQQRVNLISQYRSIYPKATDIKRKTGPERLFTLEHCAILQEMNNRGSLYKYMQLDTVFNTSISKIFRYLMKTLEIEADKKASSKSFIGWIKGFWRLRE